ncbi:Hypothetical protein, putative [Bodo saltans]|uniref:Uncharacterized protein n=2 Tax=Bodo saltans TaxID=75058 RepID=A0A0S4KGR6_BODSA|nr:Hypothetical protein, putative [Bodo saltans]|eukprot:CUI14904.1 Hypothetical protein, putative [Bodo saltans]
MNHNVMMTPTEAFRNPSHTSSATTTTAQTVSTTPARTTQLQILSPSAISTTNEAGDDPHNAGQHPVGTHLQEPSTTHISFHNSGSNPHSTNRPPPRRSANNDVIAPHFVEFQKPTSLRVKGFPPMGVQFAAAPGYVVPKAS